MKQHDMVRTYDVLYAVNGVVDTKAVVIGPCGGKPYTTQYDIPTIIAISLGLPANAEVDVRSVRLRSLSNP